MDVHRCRFVPYQPSAINAVAFSHPRTRSAKQAAVARLAVGRANGDIEIWNPSNGTWHQELILRGGKDRSIDGLVWVNEPDQDLGDGRIVVGKLRLFSIGYTSTVTEWDLERGKPKRHASGQHGDIWCLAAQPPAQDGTPDGQHASRLIAGTIDGELVIYSIEDGDLRFQRVVVRSPTKKAQMVSVTFQSRKVAVVGCSDSTIRAYDITNGHLLRRMTLGSDLAGGSKDIIVWSVRCLPNGNIVSADSTGQVCVWDGKTYTQSQRLQSHKQDVLSLAVSADGSTIMSGGMDRRTVLYKQNTGAGSRWTKVWARRYHDHDVKAMASFEYGRISVVVAGGPDSNLMVIPLKEMGRENHRTISNLPQQPPISSASKARFIVSWWEREAHIWVIRKAANELLSSGAEDVNLNQNRKLLKTIVVKGDCNIASATINQEGTLLVISTATDIKAFRLEHQDPAKPSDVKIRSLELPQRLRSSGATLVRLAPDGKWLCAVRDGSHVVMTSIEAADSESDKPAPMMTTAITTSTTSMHSQKLTRLRRHVPRHVQNGGLGSYDRNITQVSFSADSRMLAAADLAGYVDTWILRDADADAVEAQGGAPTDGGDDDASSGSDSDSSEDDADESAARDGAKARWVRNPSAKLLPKLPSSPVVLSFSEDDYTLAAITASWNVLVFHPLQGTLTPWSRRHPRKALPAPVKDLLDLAKGVFWQGSRLWIYGVSFLLMLDMAQDLQQQQQQQVAAAANGTAVVGAESQQAGMKRKRVGASSGAGGKMAHENLAPHQIGKYANGQWEDVLVYRSASSSSQGDDAATAAESDEEMEDAGADGELTQLRNASGASEKLQQLQQQQQQQQDDDEVVSERRSWWITYKYRPVLGVVPLGGPEVALVERPTWDVEKQEKYYAGEEWER
ncbi:U3 small nucleolar RNA-associated protein 4 [Escovopsis weberi]|uniref:U3 small nucleolar RNA-associated protein 4 n=1 Tax=Escovopsis weberi TaxID=150374 RepID=A0A0M8N7G8_ESCWE|nr:U3 small nucleolar RNA-associated protein 4 [Escovopsis weberi]